MSPSRQRIAGHPRRSRRTAQRLHAPAAVPRWRRRRRRSATRHDERSRRDWLQILTTLIALGALVFTGVSVEQTGHQNAQQDSLTAQGQITDRYTAAVNQIGSPTPDLRLGGIYALERIMRDSPADQPTIVEVLSAFVRDHPPGAPTPRSAPLPNDGLLLPTDVGAALTVLGRRAIAHDGASVEDLRGTNFANADMSYLVFVGADLTDAHLTGADLTDADLFDAGLTGADLEGADLNHAALFNTDLTGARLTDTHLTGADLVGENLTGADLTHANAAGPSLCAGSVPTLSSRGYLCASSP